MENVFLLCQRSDMSEKHVTQRLKEMRVHSGLSMADLAQQLGFKGASSYQRYEDANEYKRDYLPIDLIEKLGYIFEERGDPPIEMDDVYELAAPQLLEYVKLKRQRSRTLHGAMYGHEGMSVRGEVAAGVFLKLDQVDEFKYEPIPVGPSSKYPENAQYALKVKGNSLNKIAQDRDYLLCVDVKEAGLVPMSGDIVIVERVRDDAGEIEVSAKRLTRQPSEKWLLMPESTDPRHQEPLKYAEDGEEGVTVEITAIAIMQMRALQVASALVERIS